jgi:hypothetical protein
MAASENVWMRPRLPLAGTSHCMSVSSQMRKSPLAFCAALYAFQFLVRYLRRPQLLSLTSEPATAAARICTTKLDSANKRSGLPPGLTSTKEAALPALPS